MSEPGPTPPDPDPAVVLDMPDLRVTLVPAGWIAIRPAHREYAGPWPLRYPAILGSARWAVWMPVNVVLVEHPDRTLLVDTGEAVSQPPGHFGCGDSNQERFYRNSMRIPVRPGREAPARLRAMGVDPRSVDTIVLTHLHSDHAGNLDAFERATVILGDGERTGAGAVACRLRGRAVAAPTLHDGAIGPFGSSQALTDDAAVRLISLPGHSPAHIGLHIAAGEHVVIAAGDAAFDHDQIRRNTCSAIVHDRNANQRTQQQLGRILDDGGQVLLSHDGTACA